MRALVIFPLCLILIACTVARPARPRSPPAGWIEYPNIEHPREATVVVLVGIGLTGRVEACQVTRSSGSAEFDEAACQGMRRRARFEPARNRRGRPMVSQTTISIRFRMPAE